MKSYRPTLILVAALGNLLFGAACIFFGFATIGNRCLRLTIHAFEPAYALPMASAGYVPPDKLPDISTFIHRQLPWSTAAELGTLLGVVVGGIVLVVAGLGLLRMQAWARWLTVLYCLATILWQIGYAFFRIGVVLPVAEGYFPAYVDRWRNPLYSIGDLNGFRLGFYCDLAMQLAVLVGHALGVLIVLFLPAVSAAFRGRIQEEAGKV